MYPYRSKDSIGHLEGTADQFFIQLNHRIEESIKKEIPGIRFHVMSQMSSVSQNERLSFMGITRV